LSTNYEIFGGVEYLNSIKPFDYGTEPDQNHNPDTKSC